MMTYLQKIFYLLIPLFIYSCTNITHEMAEKPPLIPLPKNTLQAVIEDARNVNNGFGTFGDISQNKIGRKLTTDTGNPISILYPNENSLDNIFDINDSGKFIEGKYLRIVVNGKNISSDEFNGLNLDPITKNLANIIAAPQYNQCFIDPVLGRFVLPRTCYWSKLESLDNIINAEIFEEVPITETTGSIYFDGTISSVQFWNGLYRSAWRKADINPGEEEGARFIYPCGKNNKNWSKGTISAYVKLITSSAYSYGVFANGKASINFIGDTDNFKVMLYSEHDRNIEVANLIRINIAGADLSINSINNNTLYHIYIVWDMNKALQGGKSVRIFLDGIEKSSTTNDLPDMSSFMLKVSLLNYAYGTSWNNINYGTGKGETYLDNLKVWNSVVSEDPSWEYNRENALHVIYGENNNYQPNNIKVGYYYVP